MPTDFVLLRLAPMVASLGLLSCDRAPASGPESFNSAAGSAAKAGANKEGMSTSGEVVAADPGKKPDRAGPQVVTEARALVESRPTEPDKSESLGSSVPEGLYMLAWQTEHREGRSVEMTVSSTDGSRKARGARHELEISTRNGEISGCVLTKEGGRGKPAPADCRMSGGKLIITIKDEAGSGNAMELRMAPNRTKNYGGTIALVSALLPGGRLEIGKATMTRVN